MRALVIAIAVLGASTAAADDRGKAEQYFRAGEQAFRNQSYAAAAASFELSYAELPLPEIAFSAAQAYRRQYYIDQQPAHLRRALELYRIYVDRVKSGGRVGDAADGIAELRRELDKVTATGAKIVEPKPRPATQLAISVSVTDEPAAAPRGVPVRELAAPVAPAGEARGVPVGAKATLDGKPVELFAPIEVTAGDHTIEVAAEGYFSKRITKRAVQGVADIVEVPLEPRPAKLAIQCERGAAVSIDGRSIGVAPVPAQELRAGSYTIAITRRGREPELRRITLGRGGELALHVDLRQTARRRTVPWLIGGSSLLLIAGGAGAVLALRADSALATLDDKRQAMGITTAELADYRRQVGRRDDLRVASIAFGGAAVVTGAAAALLLWLDHPKASETRIAPTVTAGGAGFSLFSAF